MSNTQETDPSQELINSLNAFHVSSSAPAFVSIPAHVTPATPEEGAHQPFNPVPSGSGIPQFQVPVTSAPFERVAPFVAPTVGGSIEYHSAQAAQPSSAPQLGSLHPAAQVPLTSNVPFPAPSNNATFPDPPANATVQEQMMWNMIQQMMNKKSGGNDGGSGRVPRYATPEAFNGSHKDYDNFVTRIQNVWFLEGTNFNDDSHRISWLGTLLKDNPMKWYRGLVDQTTDANPTVKDAALKTLSNCDLFLTAFKVFQDPDRISTAQNRLHDLYQTGSAAVFANEFRTLAFIMPWSEWTKADEFFKRLKPHVMMQVGSEGRKVTLEAMIAHAVDVDNRLYSLGLITGQRRTTQAQVQQPRRNLLLAPAAPIPSAGYVPRQAPGYAPRAAPGVHRPPAYAPPAQASAPRFPMAPRFPVPRGPVPTATLPQGTPMEIDKVTKRLKITDAEKKRRRENNLCYRCGRDGHQANACNTRGMTVNATEVNDSEQQDYPDYGQGEHQEATLEELPEEDSSYDALNYQ